MAASARSQGEVTNGVVQRNRYRAVNVTPGGGAAWHFPGHPTQGWGQTIQDRKVLCP